MAGIGFAPVFDTPTVFRPAEVILVLWFLLHAALTLRFTLLAACRLGAVALVKHMTMIRRKEVVAAEALALGRTLHRQTQKFESPSLQDHSFETEQNPGKKGTRRKRQNKMNKSCVLSWGRKNDRFVSGFKPATLPDSQNGNVMALMIARIIDNNP